MQKGKIKERFIGVVIGIVFTFAFMTAMPILARVTQETITVNYNNIRIAVDGQILQTEHEPFIFQGRTYLPTRDIANAAGFNVTWENATNTVHLTSNTNLNIVPNYPTHQPAQTPQPTSPPSERGNRPSDPAISVERAIEIAEADLVSRGINATYRSDSGMSWERGQWVWELLFRTQGERMPFIEFYINVDNGYIVKFEWDD
ncbi:MAG: copper amine oxidase N-terminal domain-containing protein [Defluviitaleaceae bacterium]|nr:copper amine oxidase N-terminal domain-containing protein [Defluviitaleaceae bacterium]